MAGAEIVETASRVDGELLDAIIGVCRRVQRLVVCFEEGREADKLDSLVYHVDRLHRFLLATNTRNNVLEAVGLSLTLLDQLNVAQSTERNGYTTEVLQGNHRGRPKLDIKQDQLDYLLRLGFSCPKIAQMLGVSLSTVRGRMNDCGFTVTALYSSITDVELDLLVSQVKDEFPNCGTRLMHGHLLSRGHRITQARIRESLHRVDPEGVAIRWSSAVQRRKYAVASPLSLWHLDGNHKLIR